MIVVEDVRDRGDVDPAAQARLSAIHMEAFGPEERQYSMEDMLGRAGQPDCLFRMILDGDDVIGYLYLELAPEAATAFLWYLAIERSHRSRGSGGIVVADTLDLLRRHYPTLRYAMFEVHRPSGHGDAARERLDVRRIEFYRRLGAYWVRGVDYRIPAADDWDSSVAYDPMFFALRGAYDRNEIGERVQLMAHDSFGDRPDDRRWLDLQASIQRLSITGPGNREPD